LVLHIIARIAARIAARIEVLAFAKGAIVKNKARWLEFFSRPSSFVFEH
jgi:hypothetical protein